MTTCATNAPHAADVRTGTPVLVYLNRSRDDLGRPTGFLGYNPGDPLKLAGVYISNEDRPAPVLLEKLFETFNIGHEITPPDHLAVNYRRRGHRSLSTGDIVVIGDKAYAVAPVGWHEVPLADVQA